MADWPLTPTAVASADSPASHGQLVPVDASAASVTITLPTTPAAADQAQIGVKTVAITAGNTVTVRCAPGSGDCFNVETVGPAQLDLSGLNQALSLQYDSARHVWYVQVADATVGPPRVNLGVWGIVADGQSGVVCGTNHGSNSIDAVPGVFSSADEGKLLAVAAGDPNGDYLIGYIGTYMAGSGGGRDTLTLLTAPGGTAVNASWGSGALVATYWGTDNTVALQTAVDGLRHGVLELPPGDICFLGPIDFDGADPAEQSRAVGVFGVGSGHGPWGGAAEWAGTLGATRLVNFSQDEALLSSVATHVPVSCGRLVIRQLHDFALPGVAAIYLTNQYGQGKWEDIFIDGPGNDFADGGNPSKMTGFFGNFSPAATTVMGSGNVLTPTASTLFVASNAGMPSTGGTLTVAGVTGVVTFSGVFGTTELTGCTIASGSYTATPGGTVVLTSITVTAPSASTFVANAGRSQLKVGDVLYGPCITPGATIVAINPLKSTVTMSAAAASSGSNQPFMSLSPNSGHGLWVDNPSDFGNQRFEGIAAINFNSPASGTSYDGGAGIKFGSQVYTTAMGAIAGTIPGTTVNGAGQTISTTPSTLAVVSTADMPASGTCAVAGVAIGGVSVTVTYTGLGAGNTLTSCTVAAGSYTATNGGSVTWPVIHGVGPFTGWFPGATVAVDTGPGALPSGVQVLRVNRSTSDVMLSAPATTPGAVTMTMTTVPLSGNSGNLKFDACHVDSCTIGIYGAAGSLTNGCAFDALKLTTDAAKVMVATGSNAYPLSTGIWLKEGHGQHVFDAAHVEDYWTGVHLDKAFGCVFEAILLSAGNYGSVGSGRTGLQLTGLLAAHNKVNRAFLCDSGLVPTGWDVGVSMDADSNSNSVTAYWTGSSAVAFAALTSNYVIQGQFNTVSESDGQIGRARLFTSSVSGWSVPPNAQLLEITCVGGGGGGGGGGSASSAINQCGGAGGTAGSASTRLVAVTSSTLDIVIGAVGGGGAHAAAGGASGHSGATGGDTTVSMGGTVVCHGGGGGGGGGGAANSTSTVSATAFGQGFSAANIVTNAGPSGGAALSTGGRQGGDPLGYTGGGGGGGGAASPTIGGAAGNEGTATSGGAGIATALGTGSQGMSTSGSTGDTGMSAGVSTGAGGGGGGAGAFNSGASGISGAGGNGGSGLAIVRVVA